jgi:hypothetical protein
VSKKLEEKQQRRLAEERREQERKSATRRRSLVTAGLAIGVAALVVFLIVNERRGAENIGVSEQQAGCTDIEAHEPLGRDHVEEGTPIQYNTTPPTSGPHYQNFVDPGFSDEPIQPERLVHNLEHGQIVFWYRPNAPQATIDNLRGVVNTDRIALLAAPYEQVENPHEFVMTAWGASQSCQEVSQAVVDNFRSRFQGRGPEPVGIPTFRPGRDSTEE